MSILNIDGLLGCIGDEYEFLPNATVRFHGFHDYNNVKGLGEELLGVHIDFVESYILDRLQDNKKKYMIYINHGIHNTLRISVYNKFDNLSGFILAYIKK